MIGADSRAAIVVLLVALITATAVAVIPPPPMNAPRGGFPLPVYSLHSDGHGTARQIANGPVPEDVPSLLPTFVAFCSAGAASSPISCAVAVSPGQAVVVFTMTNGSTRSLADDGGNAYTELANTSGQNSVWAVIATATAATVTFTSNGTSMSLIALVYSNVQAFMLGQTNQLNGSGDGFQVQTLSAYAYEVVSLTNTTNLTSYFVVNANVTTRVSYQAMGPLFGWVGESSVTSYGPSVSTGASWPSWGSAFVYGEHVELIPSQIVYRVTQSGGAGQFVSGGNPWQLLGVNSGDLIVVFANVNSPVSGIADNYGDVFTTQLPGAFGGAYWIWTATAGGANPVVTVTNSDGNGAWTVAEYAFRGSGGVGTTNTASGTGTAVSVSAPTSAFGFVVGVVSVTTGGNSASCMSASNTSLISSSSFAGAVIICSGDSNVLTAGTATWSATMNNALSWIATAIAITSPAPPVPPPQPPGGAPPPPPTECRTPLQCAWNQTLVPVVDVLVVKVCNIWLGVFLALLVAGAAWLRRAARHGPGPPAKEGGR